MLPGVTFCWHKRNNPLLYLNQILDLEQDQTLLSGFNQKNADEMLLCLDTVNNTLFGKIEFSQGGAYMNWILARPGFGSFIFTEFERKMITRGIKKISFKITTNPNESKETVLRRMNFYKKLHYCRFTDVNYDIITGATYFECEYKLN